MARVYAVAAFLDKLYDVVAILCLHDLRHLARVVEVECHRGIFRLKVTAPHETDLAATHGRSGILAVEDGQGRELRLAACHAVGIVAQTRLHVIDLLLGNAGVDGDDLGLYLQGHVGDGVGRECIEIFAHVRGGGLHILCERALHLLDAVIVAHHVGHLCAELGNRATEIFLDLLLAAEVGDQIVQALFHRLVHHGLRYLHSIDVGLVEKQLVDGKALGDDTHRVTVNRHLVVQGLLVGLLDLAFIDRLVADHPGHLFDDVVVLDRGGDGHGDSRQKSHRGEISDFHVWNRV